MRRALLIAVGSIALAAEMPPSWVLKFPHHPERYVGIGRADKAVHPEAYREIARSAALAQIGREISTRIRVESVSAQAENGGERSDTFAQTITESSRLDLAGYRQAAVHETETEYWAMYVLDKQEYRRAREEKADRWADRLGREAKALESDLAARRLQSASDRFAGIRKAYLETCLEAGEPCACSEDIEHAYAQVSERMQAVLGRAVLEIPALAWPLEFRRAAAGKPSDAAVFLADGPMREKWKGPFRLSIAEFNHPRKTPCPVETDADGGVDLTRPLLECGLRAGSWRVTWPGPGLDSPPVEKAVAAEWIRTDVALAVVAEGGKAGGRTAVELEKEMSGFAGLHYRVVSGFPAPAHATAPAPAPAAAQVPHTPRLPPLLEVRIREVSVDTLSGLFFTSILARVRFPGEAGWEEAIGKAGHSDPERSRARAVRDLAKAVMAD